MTSEVLFSRPVRVEALPKDGLTQTIEANPGERAALAALNGLVGIAKLTATFVLRRAGRGGVRVTGEVHAEVTQTCVVSLEPFEATLDEPIDVRFAPSADGAVGRRGASADSPETVALEGEDPPDPIVDGRVDLGALAAEFMALGLDPYPRKPGVAFAQPAETEGEDSPFGALAVARKKS
jgi:Large ribosomal RNA subunit accumulation protein YceD